MTGGATWNLEGELCRLSGQADLTHALRRLGLLEERDHDFTLEVVEDWNRSGAETYSLRFLVHSGRLGRDCLMKACVAYGSGVPLAAIFDEWLSRRAAVRDAGVSTPWLYATGSALLVEEFIPYELNDAVRRLRPGVPRASLMQEIGRTSALLLRAGFAPLGAHDWRSRGTDVVIVDFGQDLGPAGSTPSGSEAGLLSEILDNLSSGEVQLSGDDLALVGRSYDLWLECT